jgi:hypothetical protein
MAEMQAIYRYTKNRFTASEIQRSAAASRQTADAWGAAGVAATAQITVNDYSNLAGHLASGSFTVTNYTLLAAASLDLFGMITLVGGVDFTAATSNEATAASIASAIDTAVGEPVTSVVGATVTISVPGDMNGQSAIWTAPGGVSPTTVTVTGGYAVTRLTLGSGFTPFGTDPGYIDPGVSNDDCADNIAAFVNGTVWATAVAVGNVVTITAVDIGTVGNSYALAQTSHSGSGSISNGLGLSGSTFSGGVDAVASRHRSLAT